MIVKYPDLKAEQASEFLKCFANPMRLRLLCALARAEYSVGDLARAIGVHGATTSQQLTLLRREGIVSARRSGQTVYYCLADANVSRFIEALAACFCPVTSAEDQLGQGNRIEFDATTEEGV